VMAFCSVVPVPVIIDPSVLHEATQSNDSVDSEGSESSGGEKKHKILRQAHDGGK
jgi:hypothetical protein